MVNTCVTGSLIVIGPHHLLRSALLGGMVLMEWVWPSWRKCAIVEVGFKVSYVQDIA